MSNGDMPENPFDRLRAMMGPPTPEQIEAAKKARIEAWQKDERRFKAYLPHLYAARDSLREVAGHGCSGDLFREVTKNLAVLIEDVEIELRRSPE